MQRPNYSGYDCRFSARNGNQRINIWMPIIDSDSFAENWWNQESGNDSSLVVVLLNFCHK